MSDISGADPIREAVERVKRDAFAAGWKAAIEAITGAIANLEPPEGVDPDTVTHVPFSKRSPETAGALPTVGTTPHYVYEAVRKKQGMTGADVIAAVRAEGHDVAEPQIRTALSRLEKRQLLANRHRKWFLKWQTKSGATRPR
jgi:hypothetical protein